MSDARSNWSSKTGMILAATGSAVGLGAIWKFPYMAGANGGSAFIIPFILMVLFFGVTLILAEIIIGRAGRGSSVTSFRRIGGKFWAPLGFVGVLCAFLIMTYYSTVGGWCLTYLFEAIMGNAASSDLAMLEKTFLKTVSTPVSAILYQTLFLAITAGVLIFGVNKGIERISKVLMPLLFVLMIVLIIRGLTLPGAWEGLKFLFSPKWDQVTANSLLNAMIKANGKRISGGISTASKDYIINYQDLQGIGMTGKLALPTLIALCSIALGRPTVSTLAVLGEISISGTILKVDELANSLQVCLDSGAKKVLLPITSAADLGTVPPELVGSFNLIFYSSAEDAVFKALGVE